MAQSTLLSTKRTNLFLLKSTQRSWASKKSAPRRGRVTLARMNLWVKETPGKTRCRVDVPYVLIPEPLAARREHEPSEASLSEAVAGNTETSAPESAKNNRPESCSRTESVLVFKPAAARTTGGRLWSFPTSFLRLLLLLSSERWHLSEGIAPD